MKWIQRNPPFPGKIKVSVEVEGMPDEYTRQLSTLFAELIRKGITLSGTDTENPALEMYA